MVRGTRQDRNGSSRESARNDGRNRMAQSQQKNIRVTAEQWTRIETAARERQVSPNQLVVELAIEALDRREWPRTEAEIKVARASLFAAQALARGLIADGREHDVREIREFISTIVPDAGHAPGSDPNEATHAQPDAQPDSVRGRSGDTATEDG